MTSKSQRNEEGEQEVRRDTAKKRDKSRVRESSSNPPVFFENNFTSLETVALEGLDEVKSNLEELEEVNREGLTNLELKLTEALSSLHREFETLKRQVDETATAGVAGPVTVRETPKGRDNRSKNVPPKGDRGDSSRSRNKTVPNRGSDTRGNNRNQPSNFRKNYEDRKKGAPHREGCYICGETTHAARYCPSLSKLSAMVAAQKQQEQTAAQTGRPSGEQSGQTGGTDRNKNVAVGMFNHMALFNHLSIAALVAQPACVCGAGVVAKSGGGACAAPQGATLISSSSGGEADAGYVSAGLKPHTDYFPALEDDFEAFEEQVAAKEEGAQLKGTWPP
ncbi:hypothetical protein H5410_013791 [Solanum commersonii]|uniref:CCHC-type domain-containing protein n=1 Tax=Solanum commersonii TaxID=4109 RepID=A0A9J5ZPI0_SOLCO|nr:hypothetical protein H5410_013791 [Solanum commersonii]